MDKLRNIAGIIPALITPLTSDREFDEQGMRKLIKYVLDAGVHGVFVMGSSGEFVSFAREERRRIVEFVVDEIAGRIPVFAGVSDSSTNLAVLNAKEAEKAGADAAVLVLPFYFPTNNKQDMLDHYRYVKDNTSLPLAMYNVPSTVKALINPDTIHELVEDGTIFALKDSSCDFNHFQQVLMKMADHKFPIFQGSEPQTAASVLMGGHGGVLGLGNIAPELCVKLYEAASQGRLAEARELQEKMTRLWRLFWAAESPMGGMKASVALLGICGPTTTRPIRQASDASMAELRKILNEAGLATQ